MLVNRTKSEKENLIAHINEALAEVDSKAKPILESDVVFGPPKIIPGVNVITTVNKDDPNASYTYNTQVEVRAAPGSSDDRMVNLEYRRIHLGLQQEIVKGKIDITLDKPRSEITNDVLKESFCQQYQFRNDSIEIVVEDTPNLEIKKVKLYPIEDSYLYVGEMRLTMTFKPEVNRKTPISFIFENPTTSGEAQRNDGYGAGHLHGMEYETSD